MFWQIFCLTGSCLQIWVKIVIFLASFKMHPTHESISETSTPPHPPTDHFLWLGIEAIEGFSGKITFSNKRWWTLDKKTLLAHLSFPSLLCFLLLRQCAFVLCHIEKVRTSRFQAFGSWVAASIMLSLISDPSMKTEFVTFQCVCELFGWVVALCGSPVLPEKD